MLQFRAVVVGIALLLQQPVSPVAPIAPQPFDEWLKGVRAEALTRGIREATVDQAFDGLEPLPVVVERDRTQAELVLTLDRYLQRHLTKKVVNTATTMRRTHAEVLEQVQKKYGVPPGIVIAIWGLESNFGRFSGVRPTIQTLATLAYDPRRSAMFREELFAALSILDSGDVQPAAMRGSWAGALGQPQFMPSSFLLYAQDFDGDGKRDIWTSTADVFASIGNYLSAKGRQLKGNPRAAAVMHWDALHRQVRIEGPVVAAPEADSDALAHAIIAYFDDPAMALRHGRAGRQRDWPCSEQHAV